MKITYKNIEAAREIRLWIGQIVVPAAVIAVATPQIRNGIANKVREIKTKIDNKKAQ